MKKELKEKWIKLYKIANEFKKLEPWKYFSEFDILTLKVPDKKEPYFCNIEKNVFSYYAISIYDGYRAIDAQYEASTSPFPTELLSNYHMCTTCVFGKEEDYFGLNDSLIEELDLEDDYKWIYFLNFQLGFEACRLTPKKVDMMILCMTQFLDMMRRIITNKIDIDFEDDMTFERCFNKKINSWVDVIKRIDEYTFQIDFLELDEENLKRFSRVRRINKEYELEIANFIPIRFKGPNSRACFPLVYALADKKTGEVFNIDLKQANTKKIYQDALNHSLNLFLDFMFKNGLPKAVYVRDTHTLSLVEELFDQLDIDIIRSPQLKVLDKLITDTVKDMSDFGKGDLKWE
ncbi:MAG: hypothetical protein RSB76_00645 [Clostridia bacterium]